MLLISSRGLRGSVLEHHKSVSRICVRIEAESDNKLGVDNHQVQNRVQILRWISAEKYYLSSEWQLAEHPFL